MSNYMKMESDNVYITKEVADCTRLLQEGLFCICLDELKEADNETIDKQLDGKNSVRILINKKEYESSLKETIETAERLGKAGKKVEIVSLPGPNRENSIGLAEYLLYYTVKSIEKLPGRRVWEIILHQMIPPGSAPTTAPDKIAIAKEVIQHLKFMPEHMRKAFVYNDLRERLAISKREINELYKSIIKEECSSSLENVNSFFDDSGKLLKKKLGEHVMSSFHFITMEDTKEIYYYFNGVYVRGGEDVIKRIVQDSLGDYCYKHHKEEIIDYIKTHTAIKRSQINHDCKRINLLNGIYNLEAGELEPHDPDYISTVQIPVKYDPDTTCPEIKKFLGEVLTPIDIPLILEFVGYSMIIDTRIQKSIMLIGKGANGKSKLLEMVTKFIGEDNCSGESLQRLESDECSVAELEGKLLNVFPDLASSTMYESAIFKQLTGDDGRIRARRKYGHPFLFKNTARMIFSANQLPPVPRGDFAYFRRWILIKFDQQFRGATADKNLLAKITTPTEMSGLFNLVVKSLKCLLDAGEYSYDRTEEDVSKMYLINSDPIAAFADECITFSEDDSLKSVVYDAYVNWCTVNKIEPKAYNIFAKRFKTLGFVPDRDTKIDGLTGKRPGLWLGCTLKKSISDAKDPQTNPDSKKQVMKNCSSGLPRFEIPMLNICKRDISNERNNKKYTICKCNGVKNLTTLTEEVTDIEKYCHGSNTMFDVSSANEDLSKHCVDCGNSDASNISDGKIHRCKECYHEYQRLRSVKSPDVSEVSI